MHRQQAFLSKRSLNIAQLFLLLLASYAEAQQSINIALSPESPVTILPISRLEIGKILKVRLHARSRGNLLVEYIPSPSPRPTNIPREQGRPDIILSAAYANGNSKRIFITEGIPSDINPDSIVPYLCTQKAPCLRNSDDTLSVDKKSFRSFDDRYNVILRNVPANENVSITVLNYDRGRKIAPPFSNLKEPIRPVASASLRLSLLQGENELCPGYVSDDKPICAGNGRCEDAKCKCNLGYTGTLCRHFLFDMNRAKTFPKVPDPGPRGWLGPPLENGVLVEVPPYGIRAFSWTQNSTEKRIFIKVRILAGVPKKETDHPQASDTRLSVIWIGPGENISLYHDHFPRPGFHEAAKQDRCFTATQKDNEDGNAFTVLCSVSENLELGSSIRFVLYANPLGSEDRPLKSVIASVQVVPCGTGGQEQCSEVDSGLEKRSILLIVFGTVLVVLSIGIIVTCVFSTKTRKGFGKAVFGIYRDFGIFAQNEEEESEML